MNSYNLYSPNGEELKYPHFTKFGTSAVSVVTTPDKLIEVGDEVFVAQETKSPSGEIAYAYFNKPRKVISITEKRPAKGKHREGIKAIFQKLSV